MPAALTCTSACPAAGSGIGTSMTLSTSTPPYSANRTACIAVPPRWSRSWSGGQFFPQELKHQRPLQGPLLVVSGGAVPALNVLVVTHFMPLFGESRHHFARVPRVHPIVPGRGDEEHRRVLPLRRHILIGRKWPQVVPLGFDPRGAV